MRILRAKRRNNKRTANLVARQKRRTKREARPKAPPPAAVPTLRLPDIYDSLGCVDEGRKHLAHVLVVLREIEHLAPWLGKLADGSGVDWTFSKEGIEENSKFLAENLQHGVGICIDALRAFDVVETVIRDAYEAAQ